MARDPLQGAIELVEFVATSLVSKPDQVKVSRFQGEDEMVLELRVADEDVGKVIGKNGGVARAMRALVNACGVKEQKNYQLEIVD